MAIESPKAIGDAPAGRAEAKRRTAENRVSCPRGMTPRRQGKKVDAQPLRPRRSRRSRPSGRSSHKRGLGGRALPDSIPQTGDLADVEQLAQDAQHSMRRKETLACRRVTPASPDPRTTALALRIIASVATEAAAVQRMLRRVVFSRSRSTIRHALDAHLREMTKRVFTRLCCRRKGLRSRTSHDSPFQFRRGGEGYARPHCCPP